MKIKSIQELIQMKEEINKNKTEEHELEIKSLGTSFKFRKATRTEMVAMNKMDELEIDAYNIFSHVTEPNLNDPQLQEAYNSGCKPHMIVDKLLEPSEVSALSLAIIGANKNIDLTKDVKN